MAPGGVPSALPCEISALTAPRAPRRIPRHGPRPFEHPRVRVGTRSEYSYWNERARAYLREAGRDPDSLERTDATISYRLNRLILFNLPDSGDPLSVAETLGHEVLHALLEQQGERWAARSLDQVVRPVGSPDRVGGV